MVNNQLHICWHPSDESVKNAFKKQVLQWDLYARTIEETMINFNALIMQINSAKNVQLVIWKPWKGAFVKHVVLNTTGSHLMDHLCD